MSVACARAAKARARVTLHKFGGPDATYYRGLLSQIREAGLLPEKIAVCDEARSRHEWTDEQGRECSIRPYATYQWEIRVLRLPAERERNAAERTLDQAETTAKHKRGLERRQLEDELEEAPIDAASARQALQDRIRFALYLLEGALTGGIIPLAPGCRHEIDGVSLDDESRSEIELLAQQIRGVSETATVYFDSAPLARKRARLKELRLQDARGDRRFAHALREVLR